jgi:hypothetical protein
MSRLDALLDSLPLLFVVELVIYGAAKWVC